MSENFYYDYNYPVDFQNSPENIDIGQLNIEISEKLSRVESWINFSKDEDSIVRVHTSEELSLGEKNTLDSIIRNHIPINLKYSNSTTIYDAVVSSDKLNPQDYYSISAAFADGNKSVYVKNGTYYETADIVIPDGGQLIGEAPGYVVIILLAGSKIVSDAIGASGGVVESTGTVSISPNSRTVTGVGTNFTNVVTSLANKFVLIGTNYYEIESVESDTSLTIRDFYYGNSIESQQVKIHPVFSGIRFENAIVYGSSGVALSVRGVRNSTFNAIALYSCNVGAQFSDSSDLSILSFVINSCATDGFRLVSCYSISCNIVNNYNNGGSGFVISGDSFNLNFQTCTAEACGADGFSITDSASLVNLSDVVVKQNRGNGVISGSGVSKICVNNCEFSENGSAGVRLESTDVSVSNSSVFRNAGSGVVLGSSSVRCSVIGSNLSDAFDIGGGFHICSSNKISGGCLRVKSDASKIVISSNIVTKRPSDAASVFIEPNVSCITVVTNILSSPAVVVQSPETVTSIIDTLNTEVATSS